MRALIFDSRQSPALQKIFSPLLSIEEVSGSAMLSMASAIRKEQAVAMLLAVEDNEVIDWVKKIRETGFTGPVVVHSDFAEARLRAEFLNSGADDVIVGLVDPQELHARLNAIVRRLHGIPSDSIEIGSLTFHLDGRNPTVSGQELHLSRREHEIMAYLALNNVRFVSRAMIYEAIYALSPNPPFEKIIDVYICRLRSKLAQFDSYTTPAIEMVKGRGYRICYTALAQSA